MSIENRTILITGAAQGIGAATASLFYSKGWKLILLDLDFQKLRNAFAEISEDRVLFLEADVSDVEKLESLKTSINQFCGGQINVLFNNAGVVFVGAFDEVPLHKQHQIVDVNLKGVLNVTHLCLPFLKAANESHVVSMASASAIYGNPEIPVYAATKSAIQSLTEGWSIAFEEQGIEFADIAPIFVSTKMVTDNYGKYRKMEEKDVRILPEDVAEVVWKSIHSKKIHWYVGRDTKLFAVLSRFLPQRSARYLTKKFLGF